MNIMLMIGLQIYCLSDIIMKNNLDICFKNNPILSSSKNSHIIIILMNIFSNNIVFLSIRFDK